MKKVSLVLFGLILGGWSTFCNAQNKFTVWYGANVSNIKFDEGSEDSELKALNFGVDYTSPINDIFDWTGGVSYVTKGCKDWDPGFLQIDVNATWNFVKTDDIKVGVLTGPYADFMIAKDDAEEVKTFSMGWQGGVKASYKDVSLKVGYEYGLTDLFDGGKSKQSGVYVRLGYSF